MGETVYQAQADVVFLIRRCPHCLVGPPHSSLWAVLSPLFQATRAGMAETYDFPRIILEPRAPGPTCMCLGTFWSAHSICIQELLESAEFQPINHLIYLFGGQIHIINGSRNWNMFDFRSWSFNTDMFGSNVIFFRKVNFDRIRTMRRRLAWLRQVDGFRFRLEKSVSFAVQKDDRCPMPDAWFVGQMLMIIWKWFVGVIEKREFNCF